MAKSTNESEKIIEENLSYIGLDLKKIPKFLTEFETLNFRPIQSYDETTYKVYKHVNIKDIQILITPTDRLMDLKERYKLAVPICAYLDESKQENIENFTTFLKMLKDLKIENIEKLEEEQEVLKKQLPTKVKYDHNFVWQIYYSDYAKKYFMLVPTKEQDTSPLFYLLKKQIEKQKVKTKETIFVPISHMEYSGEFLSKSELADIENYMWYFTKEWVSIYEVYDISNKMNIKIVGSACIYEKIRSDYTISLKNKEQAIKFYKLLKAMFILSTGTQEEYKFKTKISKDGNLQFKYRDTIMEYEGLAEFIKTEYKQKIEELKNEIKENKKLETRLKKFNSIVEDLTQEYLIRQNQIATFLECKKTFLGKVKYFFKKKKPNIYLVKKVEKTLKENNNKEESTKLIYEEEKQYTIEDLIHICNNLENKRKENTNLRLDIQAIEAKKDMLSKKIDNADLYIKEIDKHKKSIFEFWKFTSKDEVQTLNKGEKEEEEHREKIAKFFNYETDLEDMGKMADELQRRKLSKNETDGIFAIKEAICSIRELTSKEEILENIDKNKVLQQDLKRLKENYKNDLEYINKKDFDIFGNMSDDKTKIKVIHNEKHREMEKDKYKILNINLDTTIQMYYDNIKQYINLVKEAFNKIQALYNMSVYNINDMEGIKKGIDIFDINPENLLKKAMQSKKDSIILSRINIKEGMPILYYTNIIFYDNFNKTLPVGMDLSSEVLLNLDKLNLKEINQTEFYINYSIDEFTTKTKKIKLYEYET